MLWFAAHAVYVFEVLAGRQASFPVQEVVLLVRARSSRAALAAATRLARQEELVDDSLTLDGRPARQRLLGVRKVVECAAHATDQSSADGRLRKLRSGAEATYCTYRVSSRGDLKKLMQRREISVTIED
jgi:hypothetical protein